MTHLIAVQTTSDKYKVLFHARLWSLLTLLSHVACRPLRGWLKKALATNAVRPDTRYVVALTSGVCAALVRPEWVRRSFALGQQVSTDEFAVPALAGLRFSVTGLEQGALHCIVLLTDSVVWQLNG